MTEEDVKKLQGLSTEEVRGRLLEDGYNELASARRRGIFHILFGILKEPMFILLIACGTLYLVLGDIQEAFMLLGFVFVIIGITIYQENKTEKALDALKDLSSPRALVIRNGGRSRIPGREVVRGDIIIVQEGDRVPADSSLLWSLGLQADESLLTGESVPVRKSPAAADDPSGTARPGGDDLPYIFSGSLIVQGQGVARVMSTGAFTEMGKIGKALQTIREESTPLQKETGRLVRTVFAVAAVLCAVIILVYGLTRKNWIEGILSGLTLAMAMLPEEFPVVLTIFLALGAWRMSRKNVLARRVAAIETLGAATVLCVDKTGTLTENRMSIRALYIENSLLEIESVNPEGLTENFHELVEYGILASKKDPFDPMEKALKDLGLNTLSETEHLHEDWALVEEYPLSKKLLALSHAWKSRDGEGYVIAAKGAPEAVCDLCHLPPEEQEAVYDAVQKMAEKGLRVLGVARAEFGKDDLPGSQHDFHFTFIGLLGLADPVRSTVPASIAECRGAGIRVVMITGDYPVTARNIAEQIGLDHAEKVITGPEIEAMNPEELKQRVRDTNVFARVVPEQKLLLVNALKASGEVVAMTGDGVNDAPALKSAHIGVAMGERGTDVARESASLVLLKDDFLSIVEAVKTGRRIFDNLKKAMAYILSVHVPIAGVSLLPVILGWPIILYPVHIVFLELIIDPACSVVFESEDEERNIMTRPPRNPDSRLFSGRMLLVSLLQGLVSLATVIAVYRITLRLFGGTGSAVLEARTAAFVTLIFSNLCLILTNRSWVSSIFQSFRNRNKALPWVLAGSMVFLVLVLFVPFLRNLFHFTLLHPLDILLAAGAGLASVLWFEGVKAVSAKRKLGILDR